MGEDCHRYKFPCTLKRSRILQAVFRIDFHLDALGKFQNVSRNHANLANFAFFKTAFGRSEIPLSAAPGRSYIINCYSVCNQQLIERLRLAGRALAI